MKTRYRLAKSAKRDLQQISDYWTERAGANVALRMLTVIIETIIALSRHPKIGVVADQFGAGVRRIPAGNYIIYYRSHRSQRIEVLHVFHGAREQTKAWKNESDS